MKYIEETAGNYVTPSVLFWLLLGVFTHWLRKVVTKLKCNKFTKLSLLAIEC